MTGAPDSHVGHGHEPVRRVKQAIHRPASHRDVHRPRKAERRHGDLRLDRPLRDAHLLARSAIGRGDAEEDLLDGNVHVLGRQRAGRIVVLGDRGADQGDV